MLLERLHLRIGVPMKDFVEGHPCEVWAHGEDGLKFHSRYRSMICAAKTLLHVGGGEVRDRMGVDGTWDYGKCRIEVSHTRPWRGGL